MKKLPLSIVISAGVHAFVVTAALAYEPATRPDLGEARPANPIELVEVSASEPVAVVLLDAVADDFGQKFVTAAELVPTAPAMERTSGVMRAVAARAGTGAVTTEPIVTPGTGDANRRPHAMFSMRDKRVELFSQMKLRHLERVPEGTKPAEHVPETGKLQPSGNGTYRSNEGVFTARVERDGSVNLKDARNLRITSWPDPRKIVKVPSMIGNGVANWYTQEDKTPKDPDREPINTKRPVEKDTRPDHGQTATVPILGGGFDVTDAFMRRKKIDPYASKKLAYLDSTRDERVQIGHRHRKDQLAKSTELMQKQLDVVWTSTVTIAAKKQALFELWEDCAESGESAVVEGGRAARALVVGFINAKFPKGSANAFTSTELAGLNKKRPSKTSFEPYSAGR